MSNCRKMSLYTRRQFVAGAAALMGSAPAIGAMSSFSFDDEPDSGVEDKARDEAYWRMIAQNYDQTEGIINLEHGYWGKMARPVKAAYLEALERVNRQNSFYARKDFRADYGTALTRVAATLGAKTTELVLTENATEAFHSLIRQYRHFEPGDGILMADIDYPAYKRLMRWQAKQNSGPLVEVTLPDRSSQDEIFALYKEAFDANPGIKLMLVTHVSNQHGLIVPIARIAAEARRRGITVMCDAAQSWGLLDFQIADLDVDYAIFNLHKWIGAPLGLGALYIRQGAVDAIAPYPGDAPLDNQDVTKRVHRATWNFAAALAVPAALDFHTEIGPTLKQARLQYLRDLWVAEADGLSHIQVLGGKDAASRTGIGSFRISGHNTIEDAKSLQQRLEQDFDIFTVVRDGLKSGSCVRVTPQVFTKVSDIEKLVQALHQLA